MTGVGVSGSSGQINFLINGSIDVNHTFTIPAGTPADVINVGTSEAALLDFYIPAGGVVNGTAGTITINHTFTLPSGASATVTNIGTLVAALFDFGIPKGDKGDTGAAGYTPVKGVDYFDGINGTNGTAATVAVNYTFTGAPGISALVSNIGTSSAASFDFTIPMGATGAAGTNGANGTNGTAATIAINNTVTGSPASVTNIGNASAANFDFVIPAGATGAAGTNGTNGTNGINGTSATIVVNSTFTGIVGSAANVTNVGNTTAGRFDFTIPVGETGAKGDTGNTGSAGGQLLFFRHLASTDPITYEGLVPTPYGAAEVDENGTINDVSGKVLIDAYITDVGYPAVTKIPAGLWTFNSWAFVSSPTGVTTFVLDVYTRATNGTETLLFTATTEDIDAATVTAYHTYHAYTPDLYVPPSTRLVVKVSAQTTKTGSGITYHWIYEGTVHTSNIQTTISTIIANAIFLDAKSGANALYKGQAVYISGSAGGIPVVDKADNLLTAKTRVAGLIVNDVAANTNVQFIRVGQLTNVDTQASNTNINPNGETWLAGDLLFSTATGGLTKVRPTSGRSVKAGFSMTGSNQFDSLLAYPFENPVWVTGAATEDVVLRMGDSAGVNKVSFRNYTNTEVAWVRSNGTSSFTANAANITQYSYLTLMAGSGIVPTTNPPSDFNQLETATNKNNFIYANISNGGTTQNVQWMVDMPADWNGGNIIAQFLWTVQSGSGDANWTLSGVRIGNDDTIDVATPVITYKVDTVLTSNDIHVSDATTAAAVTGTGNTIMFKVGRSATSETLAVPAQLIGVRLKYIKTIGAA